MQRRESAAPILNLLAVRNDVGCGPVRWLRVDIGDDGDYTATSTESRVLQIYGWGTNRTQTGEGTCSSGPLRVRCPVLGSTRKTTISSESWLAASSQAPVGSRTKLRGVFPPVESISTEVSVPSFELIAKTAMLSSPRLEAKRNLPEECISISAASLVRGNPLGSAETICNSPRVPFAATLDCISLITYRCRPAASNIRCRGPAPGTARTICGSLPKVPPAASNRYTSN